MLPVLSFGVQVVESRGGRIIKFVLIEPLMLPVLSLAPQLLQAEGHDDQGCAE